jgi:hypothetical protein
MGLSLADLLPDYRASLNDAASAFPGVPATPGTPAGEGGDPPAVPGDPGDPDADLRRHLIVALSALSREKRPRTRLASITLAEGVAEYPDVPADLLLVKVAVWPQRYVAPWNLPPGPLPLIGVAEAEDGRVITLRPAPTAEQVRMFGAEYRYYYFAAHALTDSATTSTLLEKDRALLLLRAQAEAMRELSFRGYKKPVTLRAGSGVGGAQVSKNQTPPALWDLLMQEYRTTP